LVIKCKRSTGQVLHFLTQGCASSMFV